MPKDEFEGLPVIDVPESEEITVAVKADDLAEGDIDNPERHPIAIALRRETRSYMPVKEVLPALDRCISKNGQMVRCDRAK